MKKDKKTAILSELCDSCDPEKEALLAIYANRKKGDYFAIGDMDLIRSGIYDILNNGIAGEEGAPRTEVAWAILGALRELQDEGVDIEGLLTAFDEDDEEEDCDTCALLRVCGDGRAVKWRKMLGIPKPKKGKGHKINVN